MRHIERHAISAANLHMGGTEWLKQELLMHDKIGLLHLKASVGQLHMYGTSVKTQRAETYEFLEDMGLVYEAQIPERPANPEVALFLSKAQEQHSTLKHQLSIAQQLVQDQKADAYEAIQESDFRLQCHLARAIAVNLQCEQSISAIPLLQPKSLEENSTFLRKTPVLRAVMHQIPAPDTTVSFQEILELRLDSEFIDKRNRLWAWIRKLSTDEWSEQDIRDEALYLAEDYKKYMQKNRVKYKLTSFGAIVKLSAGLIEDVVKLNLKDLSETVFSITGESASLSIAELSAPGRELALIPYLEAKSGFV